MKIEIVGIAQIFTSLARKGSNQKTFGWIENNHQKVKNGLAKVQTISYEWDCSSWMQREWFLIPCQLT
jgi:hypothetical protein